MNSPGVASNPSLPTPTGSVAPRSSRTRPGATTLILATGVPLTVILFVLTSLDVGGLATWWEIGHWTLTAILAVGLAVVGARRSSGTEQRVRVLGATALAAYLGGQLLWDGQVGLGLYPTPGPSDVLFLGMALPLIGALALAVQALGSRGQLRTFFLDGAVLTAAVVAVVFFVFAGVAAGASSGLGIVLLLYPIV